MALSNNEEILEYGKFRDLGSGNVSIAVTNPDGSNISAGGGGNANGQATMANSAPVVIASNQSNVPVIDKPATSGGTTPYRNLNLNATGVNIKASPGQVYGWYMYNNAASTRYVKFYDKATAPVVGTDTPVVTIPIPAGGGTNIFWGKGHPYTLGIGIAATNLIADADTTAPSTNDVVVNVWTF